MKNLINNLNIGLTFTRNWESNDWTGVFISNYITDIHFIGGQTYMATLYLYSKEENLFKEENFKNEFRDHINSIYGKIYAPEEILSYIYCILMSSIYKEKYREFLKIDYPRIPLIKSEEIFKKLSVIGGKMIDAHILADVPEYNIGSFMGKGNNKVTKIKLRDKKLYINEQQYFYLVLKDINEFNVGGYLVLDRYLRDRKGKQLTLEEIENIESIIKVIAFTIDQKKKIDNLIKDWI